jgi:predicted lysophospholipase L1 biosynthesis ABC-type transport system permease subunit
LLSCAHFDCTVNMSRPRAVRCLQFGVGAVMDGKMGPQTIAKAWQVPTQEATRRAIGARKKDILLQFLIESCVLSALGGLLGLLSGTALARFLAFVFRDKIELTPQIEPSFLVTSVGAGIVMGVLFGLYPAIKASRLSPADALRIS